jgi:TonB family protein
MVSPHFPKVLTQMRKRFALLLCILLIGVPAGAQSLPVERLVQGLKDNVLTLRSFSRSKELRFDQSGLPKKKEAPAPWALYGQFRVQEVDLQSNRLTLSGPRIVSHYDSNTKKMAQFRSNLLVEVSIDLKPGVTTATLGPVLSQVFIPAEELAAYVPAYWQEFLSGGPKIAPPPPPQPPSAGTQTVPGEVMQSMLTKMVRPKYPEDALQYHFEGVVVFKADISEAGNVENLMIVTPAGAGFDENAAAAVSQWKYSPTLLDGKPVLVHTTITVNYAFQ